MTYTQEYLPRPGEPPEGWIPSFVLDHFFDGNTVRGHLQHLEKSGVAVKKVVVTYKQEGANLSVDYVRVYLVPPIQNLAASGKTRRAAPMITMKFDEMEDSITMPPPKFIVDEETKRITFVEVGGRRLNIQWEMGDSLAPDQAAPAKPKDRAFMVGELVQVNGLPPFNGAVGVIQSTRPTAYKDGRPGPTFYTVCVTRPHKGWDAGTILECRSDELILLKEGDAL
jgi:hypothetical protein